MGQYYHPINLDKKEHLSSHDYDNGLKLMEHSWVGNDFVETVCELLKPNGSWYKNRIVWLGDYADDEKLNKALDDGKSKKIEPEKKDSNSVYKFLVNHSKKYFVDFSEIPEGDSGWKINPLPLLTCEGNGRGGGDFHVENSLVGLWARDIIPVEDKKPKGYEKIVFDLVE